MRVLVVDFAGHPFQAELSRSLARGGHEVRHVSAARLVGPKGALTLQPDDADTLSFVQLGSGRHWRTSLVGRLFVGLSFGRALAQEVRSFRPDAVIASNVPPESLFVAGFGRRPIRWVWWVQDLLGPGAQRVLGRRFPRVAGLVGRALEWQEAWVARRAEAIVVIAPAFVNYIEPACRGKVAVLHNWAPIGELPTVPRSNAWAGEAGLAETFNFVYTGTLGMKHDPDLLVQLAERFAAIPEVRIVVASEGIGADHLRRRVVELGLENLVLLPFQPYARLPELMGTADVLVALLEADAGVFSVPSKILSYLCAGRPILASMPPDNLASEIVLAAGAGVVVPPGSGKEFAERAETLLACPSDERIAMGNAGRRFAEQHFRIDDIVARFEGLLVGDSAQRGRG